MTSVAMTPIGDCVKKIGTWNPQSQGEGKFRYIDLSTVDKDLKAIVPELVSELSVRNAPSRARQLVQAGDVLVATVRPNLNGVALVSEEFDGATASTGYCVLRPDAEKLDSRYLFHWVKTPVFVADMIRQAAGANYPAVSDRTIKNSTIPVPSLKEQKRIAAILDKANAIRCKRQQAIQLAEQFLRAVFLDMFGEPVKNPKGWDRVILGDLIHFAKDGPHVSPKYSEDGIPFLSTRHVRPTGVIWEDLKYITQKEAQIHWKKCRPEFGDILYTKGGTTGIACQVDFSRDFAVWVHVALLRPILEKVNFIWLTHMLNSQYCYAQSQKYTRGATNKDLGLTRMVNIEMFCPPLNEQEKFVEIRKRVVNLMERGNVALNESLVESLSQDAFAGQL